MRIAALTIAAALATGAAAHAQDATDHQERIDAHKYDLSKPHDAKALLSRIEGAALNLCGAPPGVSYAVLTDTLASACYSDAVRTAVESAQSPDLTLVYEQHHGGARPRSVAVAAR